MPTWCSRARIHRSASCSPCCDCSVVKSAVASRRSSAASAAAPSWPCAAAWYACRARSSWNSTNLPACGKHTARPTGPSGGGGGGSRASARLPSLPPERADPAIENCVGCPLSPAFHSLLVKLRLAVTRSRLRFRSWPTVVPVAMVKRSASVPYSWITSMGSTTLPRLLDICAACTPPAAQTGPQRALTAALHLAAAPPGEKQAECARVWTRARRGVCARACAQRHGGAAAGGGGGAPCAPFRRGPARAGRRCGRAPGR